MITQVILRGNFALNRSDLVLLGPFDQGRSGYAGLRTTADLPASKTLDGWTWRANVVLNPNMGTGDADNEIRYGGAICQP